jgi:Flp pilus assembly protein TadB
MSLTFIATCVGALAAIAGALKLFYSWRIGKEQRDAGRTEANLERAEEESRRAKGRQRIDETWAGYSPDDLDKRLSKRPPAAD